MRSASFRRPAVPFPATGVEHEAPAHADLTVNAPDRQFDAGRLRRFAPGQHMLVDAVDQGAVQIEEEGHRVGLPGFSVMATLSFQPGLHRDRRVEQARDRAAGFGRLRRLLPCGLIRLGHFAFDVQ